MIDHPLTVAEQDDALAAEIVLGTLSLQESALARQRITNDPAFAGRVRRCQRSLSRWQVPAQTRRRVKARLSDHLARGLGFLLGASCALSLALATWAKITTAGA